MKNTPIKLFLAISVFTLASCAVIYPMQVIDETDSLLVVRATEKTKYKALINAQNKVKSMLGKYEEDKEPDCAISRNNDAGSFWECVVYAKK